MLEGSKFTNIEKGIAKQATLIRHAQARISKPETQNPKPETQNPKPETQNPKPETRNIFL